ncbi:TPA: RluA family pseudouridine synthase [Candidatus Avacholeplasma faecigallinarum]|nr:RluA family pseudouridine synthase [Candidatus Avacholeplasma faecigallinarum]
MLDIMYEDNHIIVCYKDKGILSQKDSSNKLDMLTMLKAYIKEKYNKPGNVYLGLVHRLDINTSGVMVFAKTSKAASRLSEDIKNHKFEKKYLATIEGHIYTLEYTKLKCKLLKSESEKKAYVDSNGQESILYYKALKNYQINNCDVCDVDIILKTGRFHQIRASFAHINHPLYGDVKYGSKNKVDSLKFPLQAYSLSFFHPITKEWLTFEKIV